MVEVMFDVPWFRDSCVDRPPGCKVPVKRSQLSPFTLSFIQEARPCRRHEEFRSRDRGDASRVQEKRPQAAGGSSKTHRQCTIRKDGAKQKKTQDHSGILGHTRRASSSMKFQRHARHPSANHGGACLLGLRRRAEGWQSEDLEIFSPRRVEGARGVPFADDEGALQDSSRFRRRSSQEQIFKDHDPRRAALCRSIWLQVASWLFVALASWATFRTSWLLTTASNGWAWRRRCTLFPRQKAKPRSVPRVDHDLYKAILESVGEHKVEFRRLGCRHHVNEVVQIQKRGLTALSTKACQLDSHRSRPIGHFKRNAVWASCWAALQRGARHSNLPSDEPHPQDHGEVGFMHREISIDGRFKGKLFNTSYLHS